MKLYKGWALGQGQNPPVLDVQQPSQTPNAFRSNKMGLLPLPGSGPGTWPDSSLRPSRPPSGPISAGQPLGSWGAPPGSVKFLITAIITALLCLVVLVHP